MTRAALTPNEGTLKLEFHADTSAWFMDVTRPSLVKKYRGLIEEPFEDEPNHLSGYLDPLLAMVEIKAKAAAPKAIKNAINESKEK